MNFSRVKYSATTVLLLREIVYIRGSWSCSDGRSMSYWYIMVMILIPNTSTSIIDTTIHYILLITYMSNISSRSKSRPPSSSSGPAKRVGVGLAVAADEAMHRPEKAGVDGAKATASENRRVVTAMASFISAVG